MIPGIFVAIFQSFAFKNLAANENNNAFKSDRNSQPAVPSPFEFSRE